MIHLIEFVATIDIVGPYKYLSIRIKLLPGKEHGVIHIYDVVY